MTDLPSHAHRSPSGGLPFAARAGDGYVEALEAALVFWTHEFVPWHDDEVWCDSCVVATKECDPVHHTPRWVRARLEQGRQG